MNHLKNIFVAIVVTVVAIIALSCSTTTIMQPEPFQPHNDSGNLTELEKHLVDLHTRVVYYSEGLLDKDTKIQCSALFGDNESDNLERIFYDDMHHTWNLLQTLKSIDEEVYTVGLIKYLEFLVEIKGENAYCYFLGSTQKRFLFNLYSERFRDFSANKAKPF